MSKSAQQWIEESTLPAEVKAAALKNIKEYPNLSNRFEGKTDELYKAINAIDWGLTPEGFECWDSIYNNLRLGMEPSAINTLSTVNIPTLDTLHLPAIPWPFVNEKYDRHAFDADGDGCFYSKDTEIDEKQRQFTISGGNHTMWQYSGLFFKTDRWRETLQFRPK